MSAALSIDFGNSYTKVGIRRDCKKPSEVLRNEEDLRYDEDHLCIPTVTARVIRNGRERWLFGTEVKLGSKERAIQVFRNWKHHFFRGEETHLEDGKIMVDGEGNWGCFTNEHLQTLLNEGSLRPEKEREVRLVLERRIARRDTVDENFDFKEMGKEYFAWLRRFVEPYCELHDIGTTGNIPVRITMPSFGANSSQARLALETSLQETGWTLAEKQPTLPEPVANFIGTFTSGRNWVWRASPTAAEFYSLAGMMQGASLYKAIKAYQDSRRGFDSPIYWVMIADLGGYTTDFAMVGFNLDDVANNIEIHQDGNYDGKRLLGHYSEPIGIHDLDKQVGDVLSQEHRKAFKSLTADVDGLRIDRFHQEVYQRHRPYNTGLGIIGQQDQERKKIEEMIRHFADRVAEFAERFLLIEQYDHIDELILTGGGCNIPIVHEAIRRKLGPYNLKNSHIPASEEFAMPPRCERLERLLVRGATALGATSVFFDYD